MLAFLGDVHNMPHLLRKATELAEEQGASALIQVGDLGFGPSEFRHFEKRPLSLPVYFIDGNHEEFELLQHSQPTELAPRLWYMPRGTVVQMDGKLIGFLGGAGSIDKDFRIRSGWRWDPREQITPNDVARFDQVGRVDILVTHTPPHSVIERNFDPLGKVQFGVSVDWTDPSAQKVELVWLKLGYPQLICGHMHRSVTDGRCTILNEGEGILVR